MLCCGSLHEGEAPIPLNNSMNKIDAELFLEHNAAMMITPLFCDLELLWQLHHPLDCMHYCYSLWRFDVMWDCLLRSLWSML